MSSNISEIVWSPSEELISTCALSRFISALAAVTGREFANYHQLHAWSVREPEHFWREALQFLEIRATGLVEPTYSDDHGVTPLARNWFPRLSLNFADNLLAGAQEDLALVSWSEDRIVRRLTRKELREKAGAVAAFCEQVGVKAGDRVFGYLPNVPEAVIAMLGAAKLGATWSSCGTDYQVEGVIARIERVKPKVLVVATAYLWRGEVRSLESTIASIFSRVSGIEAVILVDYLDTPLPASVISGMKSARYLGQLPLPEHKWRAGPLYPFSHPLYILFSSGTTGKPKGIVHGAGNTLLEHKKEHILHSDIRKGDRFFYQTSTSWMMWNWLVSGMASGARVILYDGDPFCESGEVLWRLADTERVTHFGTSAAYLSELCKRKIEPATRVSLSDLRAIFSTGSVLAPELFDYVSRSIKRVWLQSISGGSDIIGCFGLGSPLLPVYRGEVQCKSLGYDVAVFNPQGVRVVEEQGELVCAAPAPSMPLNLLDDPDGASYQAAYFADYPGIWRHGDFVRETAHGGLVFGGRSDATLKPGGVRISTAEIYAALQRVQRVQQALAVGYASNGTTSEQIVLFVLLGIGDRLDKDLECEIRCALKQSNLFYLPAVIIQAPDLPRTPNNKLAELTVKRVLHGHDPGNISALVNPECLEFFVRVTSELQSHLKNPKPV